MDTFKELKYKYYIHHVILGTFLVLFSVTVLQGILFEIFYEYDTNSIIAYILGICLSVFIMVYGIFQFIQAFKFEKNLLNGFGAEQTKLFFDELNGNTPFVLDHSCVLTEHFLLLSLKYAWDVKVIRYEDLIACFEFDRHKESNTDEKTLVIYDSAFKPMYFKHADCDALYLELRKVFPWICSEDYDEFLIKIQRLSFRKKIVKEIEEKRIKREMGYDLDNATQKEIEDLSMDTRVKLNTDKIFELFHSKKMK